MMGNEFFQTGRGRSERRTLREMLLPPEGERSALHWHFIDTPAGRLALPWRPGIEVWLDRAGQRDPAEQCAAAGRSYHGGADPIGTTG